MRGGPVFAQVLDDKLREFSEAASAATESKARPPYPFSTKSARLSDPFLFAAPYRPFRPAAFVLSERPVEARRARALKPCEHKALASLNQLGACLSSDYSAGELRRAFRLLARQYHPDRHPSSDAAEQARLAHIFSTITEHHRCLASALEL
jgi:hypothetical protein